MATDPFQSPATQTGQVQPATNNEVLIFIRAKLQSIRSWLIFIYIAYFFYGSYLFLLGSYYFTYSITAWNLNSRAILSLGIVTLLIGLLHLVMSWYFRNQCKILHILQKEWSLKKILSAIDLQLKIIQISAIGFIISVFGNFFLDNTFSMIIEILNS